ncbi:DUF5592 family protein [Fictibacillus enclensis]|uniref:DUF5592 family protein n=1 Tax=Fictibacillus enclensis TaxID=1017270 RepID=UPI00259FFED2|nr:DUF5592 family protein [Fictibacillus enclensis]MDM5335781.1 DUF5592 family protein [Fictibacillus enclensis]
MYRNPKNTKQEIKLFAFYLLDIGIVAAMLFIANYVMKVIPLNPVMSIIYYILSGAFGIFLCAKTPNHPVDRNASVLLHLFRMDRNKYHAVDVKEFKVIRKG